MFNIWSRNSLINVLTIFFLLIPISLQTGPFLPDLFLSLIAIIFLIVAIKENQKKYFKNNFFYIFCIFNIYLICSSLFSEHINFSLKSSLLYFRYGIFALAVWFLIDNNNNFIKYFTYALLTTFIISIANGYFQFHYGENFFGFKPTHPFRLTLLYDDRLILGGFIARLMPLLIGLIIYHFTLNKKVYLFLSFLLIISDVLIYITGERTALGLLFFQTIFLLLLISKFKVLRLITFITSILIITFLSTLPLQIKERNIDHTMTQLGINGNDDGRIKLFSAQHESFIFTGLNIFNSHRILGSGPNTFRKNCSNIKYAHNDYSCSTHPHHTYIQLLAETGIIGFTFVFGILCYFAYTCLTHFISIFSNKVILITDYQICLICCMVISLFPLLPTQNFFNNWINIIYYIPIGFYLNSLNVKKK